MPSYCSSSVPDISPLLTAAAAAAAAKSLCPNSVRPHRRQPTRLLTAIDSYSWEGSRKCPRSEAVLPPLLSVTLYHVSWQLPSSLVWCPGSCPPPPLSGGCTADPRPLHLVRASCHHWSEAGHDGCCERLHGGKERKPVLWQQTWSSRRAGPWRGVTSNPVLNVQRVLVGAGVSTREFLGLEVLLSECTLKSSGCSQIQMKHHLHPRWWK